MKSRNFLAFVLMLVMLLSSLLIGANRGWAHERLEVDALYSSLEEMLATRVETANNIITVAKRHLPSEDEALKALVAQRDVLNRAGASLKEKASANAALTACANNLLSALAQLSSVKADERDYMYVTALLPQMLADSGKYITQSEYNLAAENFNQRLNADFFSGFLARLTGVRPVEIFSEN